MLACAGDGPTIEMLAAADLFHRHLPDREFDAIFTTDRPVIFACHGYPWLI